MSAAHDAPGVTAAIASYALGARFDGPEGEKLLALAKRAFIDTVGVTVAAREEPPFVLAAKVYGEGKGEGRATILATGETASPLYAALMNGIAGHALDYDDLTEAITGHPSVVLVPAILAAAQAAGKSGRALLEAYVVGFEVDCALGNAIGIKGHYDKGWHASATIGVVGSAAAVCRLLGCTQEQTQMALGIAATMASGSRQNFGTMTKPLHAGLAARDAVAAAMLAKDGFTADDAQLERPLGYFALFGEGADTSKAIAALGGQPALLKDGISVKKFPCCYFTQRMADGALELARLGVKAQDVESVDVWMEPGGLVALIHHRPQTGLQAKFSAEYVVAAGLYDKQLGLASFTDEAVQRPAVQALLARVHPRESAPPWGKDTYDWGYAALEVRLKDGSVHRVRIDVPGGDTRAPLSDAELDAKFTDCVAFGNGPWDARALLAELHALEGRSDLALSPGQAGRTLVGA